MEFDFFVTKAPMITASIALRTIYVVHADPTYDVKKELKNCDDFVALRTAGGSGTVEVSGMPEITVPPGSLLFFRHEDVRRYYCSGASWDFWWFEFSSNQPYDLPLCMLMQIPPAEREEEDCKACLELLRKNDPGSGYLASAKLGVLVYNWMLCYGNSADIHPYGKAVHKVIHHLAASPDQNPPVKVLAEMTGLCERRFRQVFTDITGVPPKKYIDNLRIGLAEELLKSTPFSISEISDRLGYSSQFHFCKAFRAAHGIPPSEYRTR